MEQIDCISYLVILIMGFTQDRSELTGQESLWRKADLLTHNGLSDVKVLSPFLWNSNWKGATNFIQRNVDPNVKILVAG